MYRSGWSDLQGAGVISTTDAKLGEPFLKGVNAFCFCNHIWESVPQARAIGEDSALVCQSQRVWYAELGIAVPSACQDVNKTIMNYNVHDDDAGLRAAFRWGFPVESFQDGSDAAGSTIVPGYVVGVPVLDHL